MKDFSFKNSCFQREPLNFKKPVIETSNSKIQEMKNISVGRSEYGKQITQIKNQLMSKVKAIQIEEKLQLGLNSPM